MVSLDILSVTPSAYIAWRAILSQDLSKSAIVRSYLARTEDGFQGNDSKSSDLRSDDSVFVFPAETTEHYRIRYGLVTVRTVGDADLLNSH